MTEKPPVYDLPDARAELHAAEATNLNAQARAYLDALSVRRMELYRAAWQGDNAARIELRALRLALAALADGLPVEVVA